MRYFIVKFLLAGVAGTVAALLLNNVAVGMTVFVIMAIAVWMPVYVRYAHDNPQHFWFKRKLYGWGWTPVTWQGWTVIALYLVLVFTFAMTIDESSPPREMVFTFWLPVAVLTTLLIRIAYRKGEPPRWQWGKDISKYQ